MSIHMVRQALQIFVTDTNVSYLLCDRLFGPGVALKVRSLDSLGEKPHLSRFLW